MHYILGFPLGYSARLFIWSQITDFQESESQFIALSFSLALAAYDVPFHQSKKFGIASLPYR